METNILRNIIEKVDNGEKVAVATVTSRNGSIPGKVGGMLAVFQDGNILGTIGGGKVEFDIIQSCLKGIKDGEDFEFSYNMSTKEKMACGGAVKGFVKIYKPSKKLVIFGGGHIGRKIAKLAENLEFDTFVIDNRQEYENLSEFSNIKKFYPLEIKEGIKKIKFDKDTYIVVSTRSHELDEEVVTNVLDLDVGYIGMLGSRNKVNLVKENLKKKGFDEKVISSIFAPVGLKIDNGTPEEIALSILSEIIMVKNKLEL